MGDAAPERFCSAEQPQHPYAGQVFLQRSRERRGSSTKPRLASSSVTASNRTPCASAACVPCETSVYR